MTGAERPVVQSIVHAPRDTFGRCVAKQPNGRHAIDHAPYLISPASLGSIRLISGMQMISNNPANSASMYGT